jgi:hypothetical protein
MIAAGNASTSSVNEAGIGIGEEEDEEVDEEDEEETGSTLGKRMGPLTKNVAKPCSCAATCSNVQLYATTATAWRAYRDKRLVLTRMLVGP